MKTKVLFVCLGNICRSPMAEGLFKHYVKNKGLSDQFHFESRAIANWEQGNPVHPSTLKILDKHHVTLDTIQNKLSQRITERDFLEFDYIIGMDKNNLRFLKNFEDGYYSHKVYAYFPRKSIPDPYMTGNFEQTFKLLKRGLKRWFDKWLED